MDVAALVHRRWGAGCGGDLTLGLSWIGGLVQRRKARVAGMVLAIALAVAFLASLGAFFAASKARMTNEAVAGVPVDWQVQLPPGTGRGRAAQAIAAAPGGGAAVAVGYGRTPAFPGPPAGPGQAPGPG